MTFPLFLYISNSIKEQFEWDINWLAFFPMRCLFRPPSPIRSTFLMLTCRANLNFEIVSRIVASSRLNTSIFVQAQMSTGNLPNPDQMARTKKAKWNSHRVPPEEPAKSDPLFQGQTMTESFPRSWPKTVRQAYAKFNVSQRAPSPEKRETRLI
jgi:hypothetical protein